MGPDDLHARCKRLGEIARGLAKELTLWEGSPYPMAYDARKEYLEGLRAAIRGLERSRVALHAVASNPKPYAGPILDESEGELAPPA